MMRFNDFRHGQRCPICAGKQKHTIEEVKDLAEKTGNRCISEEYKNAFTKLRFQCPVGHIYEMKFNNFQQGQRCPVCSLNDVRLTFEKVSNFIDKTDQKLISEGYLDSKSKLEFQCPLGHIYKKSFNSFQQGQRCPICTSKQTTSKAEKEIQTYVESIYKGTIKPNNKKQIINPKTGRGLELDIYLPEINKAIEYNGTYWHSTPYQKYKDNQKVIQCQQKGIDLLVILEEEWRQDKEACINRIKAFIGAIK